MRHQRTTRVRRKRQWFRKSVAPTVLGTTAPVELLSFQQSDYSAFGFGDPTVVRIRGEIWVHHDSAVAGSTRVELGILASQETLDATDVLGAGGSAVNQLNADFMWFAVAAVQRRTASLDSEDPQSFKSYLIDIKAMRVLRGTSKVSLYVANLRDAAVDVAVFPFLSVLMQE